MGLIETMFNHNVIAWLDIMTNKENRQIVKNALNPVHLAQLQINVLLVNPKLKKLSINFLDIVLVILALRKID
jgi:hypothetical protein